MPSLLEIVVIVLVVGLLLSAAFRRHPRDEGSQKTQKTDLSNPFVWGFVTIWCILGILVSLKTPDQDLWFFQYAAASGFGACLLMLLIGAVFRKLRSMPDLVMGVGSLSFSLILSLHLCRWWIAGDRFSFMIAYLFGFLGFTVGMGIFLVGRFFARVYAGSSAQRNGP